MTETKTRRYTRSRHVEPVVAECGRLHEAGLTRTEIATRLGITRSHVGYRLRRYYATHAPGVPSGRWQQVEQLMTTACARCGLRGEHECLRASGIDRYREERL